MKRKVKKQRTNWKRAYWESVEDAKGLSREVVNLQSQLYHEKVINSSLRAQGRTLEERTGDLSLLRELLPLLRDFLYEQKRLREKNRTMCIMEVDPALARMEGGE
jgi:hypothetical protein